MLNLRAFVFVVLSVILIFCDYKWQQHLLPLRSTISVITFPLRFVADLPSASFYWIKDNFVLRQTLQNDNQQLKAERMVLEGKMQQLAFLEQQNSELRALLVLTRKARGEHVAAEIMAVNTGSIVQQQVVLDKGESAGAYVGQLIVDAYGVIGQVSAVDAVSSRVMLITDRESAIPVTDVRNGMRAIVMGKNEIGTLELAYISDTADVQKGDVLVTSGVGAQLPAGYVVGEVSAIYHHAGERFAKVAVTPYAHINSSRYVLMLGKERMEVATPAVKSRKVVKSSAKTSRKRNDG